MSGTDQDGVGLSTQCECEIKVKDVNDNFPVLKYAQVTQCSLGKVFIYIHILLNSVVAYLLVSMFFCTSLVKNRLF